MEALLSESGERDNEKLDAFARTAVDDFIEGVKALNEKPIRNRIATILSNITIVSNLFDKTFIEQHLEEYYSELDLKGDENLVQLESGILRFRIKVYNHKKLESAADSKNSLDDQAQSKVIEYHFAANRLSKCLHHLSINISFNLCLFLFFSVIPSLYTFYPWFHADRSRFFNQVTIFIQTLLEL